MKTAVIITGQTRTFRHCWRGQYWALYRKLPDPSFYVTVEDEPGCEDMELLLERYPADRVHLNFVKTPENLPVPDESYADHVPYMRSSPSERLVRTFFNLHEAYKFYCETKNKGEPATLIVKMRPDVEFHDFTMPARLPKDNEVFGCWWSRCGGINDRLAFLGRSAAASYFNIYPRLQELLEIGCSLMGEPLSMAGLDADGVVVHHVLLAMISILKQDKDGTMRRVESEARPAEVAELSYNLQRLTCIS